MTNNNRACQHHFVRILSEKQKIKLLLLLLLVAFQKVSLALQT